MRLLNRIRLKDVLFARAWFWMVWYVQLWWLTAIKNVQINIKIFFNIHHSTLRYQYVRWYLIFICHFDNRLCCIYFVATCILETISFLLDRRNGFGQEKCADVGCQIVQNILKSYNDKPSPQFAAEGWPVRVARERWKLHSLHCYI